MKTYKKIYLLILFSLCFNQNAELITQQIAIEEAIKNKVDVIVNKFLQPEQYITIVNARLDFKPLALEPTQEKNEQQKVESPYSVIPGLMPSIPTRESIYKQNTGAKPAFNYSTDKYILYQLEIIIYLNENITTGSLQNNIKALVLQNLKEIECNDCIRFETKPDLGTGSSTPPTDDTLKTTIENLKDQMRQSELELLNQQIDKLESINAQFADEIKANARYLERQDSIMRSNELARINKLEESERLFRAKQDSLYILTSIKFDEAVRGRIQSEATTKKELLSLIKMQIQGEESGLDMLGISEETQSDLFTKRPSMGKRALSGQTWIMIIVLVLLMLILLIMIMKNKQPVYLKPKATNNLESGNSTPPTSQDGGSGGAGSNIPFSETQANENEEVLRSELQSLRQSAVSMSVSEKTGANQIVQDWLDDGSSSDDSENDATPAVTKEKK